MYEDDSWISKSGSEVLTKMKADVSDKKYLTSHNSVSWDVNEGKNALLRLSHYRRCPPACNMTGRSEELTSTYKIKYGAKEPKFGVFAVETSE